jgi:uncharacterized membrane protein HdeD (DUF308 family)
MESRDTSTHDIGTRPGSITPDVPSRVSSNQPNRPGSPAWAVNEEMSAALARNWWAVALRGIFAIIFGIVALLMPGVTILALVLLFAAYAFVDGIFAIASGFRAVRRHERWGWLMLEGVADIAAAAIAFLWPVITIVAFIYLLAAWGIVSGAMLAAAAFRLNVPHGRGWMLFGGIASLIWGVLLFFWPIIGAVVLTWWMAGYALFFGGALLVLAFRLRARRHDRPPTPSLFQHA